MSKESCLNTHGTFVLGNPPIQSTLLSAGRANVTHLSLSVENCEREVNSLAYTPESRESTGVSRERSLREGALYTSKKFYASCGMLSEIDDSHSNVDFFESATSQLGVIPESIKLPKSRK